MPIEHEPNHQRFRGMGTAFIAWEPYDHDYFGYWDSLPDALHPHSNRCRQLVR
jgi:hypothetical protein